MSDPRMPGETGEDLDIVLDDADETQGETPDDPSSLDEGEGGEGSDDREPGEHGGEEVQGQAAERQGNRLRSPSRGESRIRELANENRELRRRQEDFERQLQQAFNGPSRADLERQQREREERRALMSPAELVQDVTQELRAEFRTQLQQQNALVWDRSDKSDFDREMEVKPALRRFESRVEELRRIAPGVSRLDLLDKAIGEAARKNIGAARTRQTRTANERSQGQVTRPVSGRSDVPSNRTRGGRTAGDRLDGVLI